MFQPNLNCEVQLASGSYDVYGQPVPGRKVKERCGIVKLDIRNEKTSVRADTSESRGFAHEEITIGTVLLQKTTQANIDDTIQISNFSQTFKIVSKFPQHNVRGALDHFQCDLTIDRKAG